MMKMTGKRILAGLLLMLLMCGAVAGLSEKVIYAHPGYVVDQAGLLSSGDRSVLEAKLQEISLRQGMDVVAVTTSSTEGKSAMDFADDFYDYNGYAASGILLLIDMGDRAWWISTKGTAIDVFTDAGIEYIGNHVLSDLSDGDYALAFETYADDCDKFITHYFKEGSPYGQGNLPKEPWNPLTAVGGAIAGIFAALFGTGAMKRSLKSVQAQRAANNYIRSGSLHVTNAREMFLYRNVVRTRRQTENRSGGSSTHTSSSGSTHGGGGGHF